MSGPADQGFVRMFDLSDTPQAKRRAIEAAVLAAELPQLRAALAEMFEEAGMPAHLAHSPDVEEKIRCALQPRVDGLFLLAVD